MNTLSEAQMMPDPEAMTRPLDFGKLLNKSSQRGAAYNQTEIAQAVNRAIESYNEVTGEMVKPGALCALIMGQL